MPYFRYLMNRADIALSEANRAAAPRPSSIYISKQATSNEMIRRIKPRHHHAAITITHGSL